MAEQQLILIGASVRAAAFSALRAGLRPWCVDLFADADLRRVCPVRQISMREYPRGFVRAMAGAPAAPWAYTGGLENHPSLVERLARQRPLWGNTAAVLQRVRDPELLARRLPEHGLYYPEVLPSGEVPLAPGVWMLKPRRGAAGLGVEVWWPGQSRGDGGKAFYFQRRLFGRSYAAVYLAEQSQTRLLGVTRQLVGEPWLYAGPFRYCGSIGTVTMPEWTRGFRFLDRIGDVLAIEFGLRGLFGVDMVLSEGVPRVVEVNPRYTASIEVLEYATGVSTLAQHHRVFESDRLQRSGTPLENQRMIGKAILFAPVAFTFPHAGPWQETLAMPFSPWQMPAYADIPAAGTRIEAGQPILTFFATGSTEEDCWARLQAAAATMVKSFFVRP